MFIRHEYIHFMKANWMENFTEKWNMMVNIQNNLIFNLVCTFLKLCEIGRI